MTTNNNILPTDLIITSQELIDRKKHLESLSVITFDEFEELIHIHPTEHWIEVNNKFDSDPCVENDYSYCGKWLIFASEPYINDTWNKIKELTEKGDLGIGAKVSTKFHTQFMNEHSYVICVYTKDFRNKEDVERVLQEIRKVGITQRLSYKTDMSTGEGLYSKDTPNTQKIGNACMYHSTDFEHDKYQQSLFDF